MGKKTKNLILGLGNDILTDDAIGPRLVMDIKNEINSSGVVFQSAAVGGIEILEMIRDYDRVLIIDAIRTRGGVPGTVYYLKPDNFKETAHLSSFHDMNFLTALELGRRIHLSIPDEIEIIAIEIVEDLTFSKEFSPEIARRYKRIFDEVCGKVRKFIEDTPF